MPLYSRVRIRMRPHEKGGKKGWMSRGDQAITVSVSLSCLSGCETCRDLERAVSHAGNTWDKWIRVSKGVLPPLNSQAKPFPSQERAIKGEAKGSCEGIPFSTTVYTSCVWSWGALLTATSPSLCKCINGHIFLTHDPFRPSSV